MLNIKGTDNSAMMALNAALDAAAPDQESWLRGQDAWNTARSTQSIEDSLSVALDSAAPDEDSWLAGQSAFYDLYDQSKPRKWLRWSEQAFSRKQQIARQS